MEGDFFDPDPLGLSPLPPFGEDWDFPPLPILGEAAIELEADRALQDPDPFALVDVDQVGALDQAFAPEPFGEEGGGGLLELPLPLPPMRDLIQPPQPPEPPFQQPPREPRPIVGGKAPAQRVDLAAYALNAPEQAEALKFIRKSDALSTISLEESENYRPAFYFGIETAALEQSKEQLVQAEAGENEFALKTLQECLSFPYDRILVQFGNNSDDPTLLPSARFVMTQRSVWGKLQVCTDMVGFCLLSFTFPALLNPHVPPRIARYWALPFNPLEKPYLLGFTRHEEFFPFQPGQEYRVLVSSTFILDSAIYASTRPPTRDDLIRRQIIEPLLLRVSRIENAMRQTRVLGPSDIKRARRFCQEEKLLSRYMPLVYATRFMELAQLGAPELRLDLPQFVRDNVSQVHVELKSKFYGNGMLGPQVLEALGLDPRAARPDEVASPVLVFGAERRENLESEDAILPDALGSYLMLALRGFNLPLGTGINPDQLRLYERVGVRVRDDANRRLEILGFGRWIVPLQPTGIYRLVSRQLEFDMPSFFIALENYRLSRGRYRLERYLPWPERTFPFQLKNPRQHREAAVAGEPLEKGRLPGWTFRVEEVEEKFAPDPASEFKSLVQDQAFVLARIIAIVGAHQVTHSLSRLYVQFYTRTVRRARGEGARGVTKGSATEEELETENTAWRWYQMTHPDLLIVDRDLQYTISLAKARSYLHDQQMLIRGYAAPRDPHQRLTGGEAMSRPVGDYIASHEHGWTNTTDTPFGSKLGLFNGQDDATLLIKQSGDTENEQDARRRASAMVELLRYLWFNVAILRVASQPEKSLGELLNELIAGVQIRRLLNILGLDALKELNSEASILAVRFACRILVGFVFHSHLFARPTRVGGAADDAKTIDNLLYTSPESGRFPTERRERKILERVLVWLYRSDVEAPDQEEDLAPEVVADAIRHYEAYLEFSTEGSDVGVHLGDRLKIPAVMSTYQADDDITSLLYDTVGPPDWTPYFYNVEIKAYKTFGETKQLKVVTAGTAPRQLDRFYYSGFNVGDRDEEAKRIPYSLPSNVVDYVYSLVTLGTTWKQGRQSEKRAGAASSLVTAAILASQHRLNELMHAAYLFHDKGGFTPIRGEATSSVVLSLGKLTGSGALPPLVVHWLRRFLYFGKLQSTTVMDAYFVLAAAQKASRQHADEQILQALRTLADLALLLGNGRHMNLISHSLLQNLFALSLVFTDVKTHEGFERDRRDTRFGAQSLFRLYDRLFADSNERVGLQAVDAARLNTQWNVRQGQNSALSDRHLSFTMDREDLKLHIEEKTRNLFETKGAPFEKEDVPFAHTPEEFAELDEEGRHYNWMAFKVSRMERDSLPEFVVQDLERGVGLPEYYLERIVDRLQRSVTRELPPEWVGYLAPADRLASTHWHAPLGYAPDDVRYWPAVVPPPAAAPVVVQPEVLPPEQPEPPPPPAGNEDWAFDNSFFYEADTLAPPPRTLNPILLAMYNFYYRELASNRAALQRALHTQEAINEDTRPGQLAAAAREALISFYGLGVTADFDFELASAAMNRIVSVRDSKAAQLLERSKLERASRRLVDPYEPSTRAAASAALETSEEEGKGSPFLAAEPEEEAPRLDTLFSLPVAKYLYESYLKEELQRYDEIKSEPLWETVEHNAHVQLRIYLRNPLHFDRLVASFASSRRSLRRERYLGEWPSRAARIFMFVEDFDY